MAMSFLLLIVGTPSYCSRAQVASGTLYVLFCHVPLMEPLLHAWSCSVQPSLQHLAQLTTGSLE